MTDPVGSVVSRLRWFLGRLIAPVRTLGTGDAPTARPSEPDPDVDDSDER